MFLYIFTKFRNIAYKLLQAVGPLQLDLVAWFARGSCMHTASPLRSATYISKHAGANQIATRLLRHCSRSVRCCSQPAGCYRPTACGRTDRLEVTAAKVWAYLHAFLEKNVIIFVTTTPIDIKPQHMSCIWSSLMRLCAKFGHRTTRRLGAGPQTK